MPNATEDKLKAEAMRKGLGTLTSRAGVFGSMNKPKLRLKVRKGLTEGENGWDGRGKPDRGGNQDGD